MRAPSPVNALLARSARTIRHADGISYTHCIRCGLTSSRPRAPRSQCLRNRAGLRHRVPPGDASAMLALCRHRQTPPLPAGVTVKSEPLCPTHPERDVPPLCAAAEWIVKCKVLLRASRKGDQECLARFSARKSGGLFEFSGSARWDAWVFRLSPAYREWPSSSVLRIIHLTQYNVSNGQVKKRASMKECRPPDFTPRSGLKHCGVRENPPAWPGENQ